jgi:hypothetical protein
MILKQIIEDFKQKNIKYAPRVIANTDKAFSDKEFRTKKHKLNRKTIESINSNFSHLVKEIISVSAEGNKIYIECIGTLDEHFITVLTPRRK